jgi:hypothetical protein
MNHIGANQEILLSASSHFSGRKFCQLPADRDPFPPSFLKSALESACHAGKFFEYLPELDNSFFPAEKRYIWDIHTEENIVLISLGTFPLPFDRISSIDPDLFLSALTYN